MDTPLGRYELESGQNFNRWFVDLSDDIAARSSRTGRRRPGNLRLIRSAFRAALAAQAPLSQLQSMRLTLQRLACDAELVIDLHCDFESVEHLHTRRPGRAGAAGALPGLQGQPAGHRLRRAVLRRMLHLVWWQPATRFGGPSRSPTVARR
jgi:hypothetical protein